LYTQKRGKVGPVSTWPRSCPMLPEHALKRRGIDEESSTNEEERD